MPEQEQRAMCPQCGSIVAAEPGEASPCEKTGAEAELREVPRMVYRGVSHGPGPATVHVRPRGSESEKLDPRTDIKNHSPSGFSWGYRGSGPAQLALAVLADYFDDGTAVRHYQDFKDDVIARADSDEPFVVTGDELEAWMEGRQ